MKIQALEIDGYGVWSGLRIEGFSDGLNVLSGPNEAGKTTLLQFIRSMLYDFADARRHYFPPVQGGRPGGTLDVESPLGRYEIARHPDPDGAGWQVVLTAPDGTRQGEHLVRAMLAEVDEAVFNNVFAVELREMQELGALGDTEAAALLYKLTAGLDRVSLIVVLKELAASRNRLLDQSGNPCRLTQLLEEREKRRAALAELGGLTRRFQQLAAERTQLETELNRLEEDRHHAERQVRLHELARALSERWRQRQAIEDQLAAIGPVAPMPDDALQRLETLNAQGQTHRQRIEEFERERKTLRGEAAALAINEALRRHAARLEALLEQEPWLAGLQNQLQEIEREIARLEGELKSEADRLGVHLAEGTLSATTNRPGSARCPSVPDLPGATGGLSTRAGGTAGQASSGTQTWPLPAVLSGRTWATLRAPARALRRARQNLEQARSDRTGAEQTAETLTAQLQEALRARGETDLPAAMDRSGALVAQYRRRLQLDERLDQLARYRTDLEEQSRASVDRQLLPGWVMVGLGAAFVLGMVLILAGLLMPESVIGSMGWALALLGLCGSGAAVVGKFMLEKSQIRHRDALQKQLALLAGQIEQAKEEREILDRQLPRGGGPVVSRLADAEKELAALEELVPLETRRNAARQEADAAGHRGDDLRQEYQAAQGRWRQRLAALGLPSDVKASQVRRLVRRWPQVVEMQRRLRDRRDEAQRRRQDWESLAGRVLQVAADAQITLSGEDPLEHLKQLVEELAGHQAMITRHEAIRGQLRRLRRRTIKHAEAVSRIKHRRRKLFFEAGVREEEEFRRRAVQHGRSEVLRRQQVQLEQDVTAALGNEFSAEAVRELLDGPRAQDSEQREKSWRQRLADLETQVRQRLEQRGLLRAQLQAVIDDRQLPQLQLELAVLDRRIRQTVHRWRVLAVTNLALDRLRTLYEHQRQPETLKEASLYLQRMTRGRYARVWTPLDEPALRVDDAGGQSLPVEQLSRGTREQLFLSLRLALAAGYARRGAVLPMVLDDVLVNFDADRAAAAAEVLRDFAAAGHQLLIFTCHEHIENIFVRLGIPRSRLPSPADGSAAIRFAPPAKAESPPSKNRPPGRRKSPGRVKVSEATVTPPPRRPGPRTATVFDADFFDSPPAEKETAENVEEEYDDQDFDDGENAEAA